MPHSSSKTRQVQQIDESLVNHLFLRSSSEGDLCLRLNQRNELLLLECFSSFLDSFVVLSTSPIIVELLVEIDGEEALICAWQMCLPVDASIDVPLSSFPADTHCLYDRSHLYWTVQCQLALDLLKNPIESLKDSHYVCHW